MYSGGKEPELVSNQADLSLKQTYSTGVQGTHLAGSSVHMSWASAVCKRARANSTNSAALGLFCTSELLQNRHNLRLASSAPTPFFSLPQVTLMGNDSCMVDQT